MSEKVTHTPLPWTAERGLPHNRMPRVHGSDTSTICECGNMGTPQDQWEANAAFIARAVNSHAALVEALKSIDVYGSDTLSGRVIPDPNTYKDWLIDGVRVMRDRALAALKLAESGQ